jgi:predicted transcriptional regulator
MIKRMIEENPQITIPMLSDATGLSRNGVLYHLQALKEKMGLIPVGGKKNGHREFNED